MTTISTGGSATATATSNQRKVAVTSTGRRWVAFETAAGLDFWYSDDEGATWAENTSATIASGTDPSFYIDKDDHAHVAYLVGGVCSYRRMASIGTTTSWAAAQGAGVSSPGVPAVVAHREGSGWQAHVVVSFNSGTNNLPVWVPFTIAADGTVTKGTNVNINGAGHGVNAHVYPSIDFHHTGDSKTVQGGTPHLYMSWRTGSTGVNHGVRFKRATYSAGSWTWGSERGLDESNDASSGLISAAFDGSRFITAYVPSTSTTNVYVRERDAADTTTTNRTATSLAGGAITAMSVSFDDEDDIHLWAVGDTADDIHRIVYDRAGGAWDLAWTTVEATTALAGSLSLKAGHGSASIDAVWTVSSGTVAFGSLELNQAPTTATWDLTNNQAHDVAETLALDWTFNDPDDGDTQGSYAMRRQIGAAAYAYWNVGTSTWDASEVQNTSSTTALTLAASWGADGDANHKYAVKTWDAAGLEGTYSSELTVIPSAKDNPTISSPADAGTVAAPSVTVEWSATTQTAYKARLLSSASAELEATDWVTSTATTHAFSYTLANSTDYKVEVTTKNDEGLASTADTNSFSVAFTPPATPTLVAAANATTGLMTVTIANPADLVTLDGTGDYISTPDSAALDITGDIDVRVKAALDDWTPATSNTLASKWQESGAQRSYLLRADTMGTLILNWSTNGTDNTFASSTTAVPFADGVAGWVRATLDVDNGAGTPVYEVKFYTSIDGSTWTQLGTTVSGSATTSVFASTASVLVGAYNAGANQPLAGSVYSAEVRDGIGGTVVASFDANDFTVGDTTGATGTDGQGNVWTLQGDATAARDADLTPTNNVYVRVASGGRADIDRPVGGDGIRIATGVAAEGTFTDYAVASGVDYEYLVRAVAGTGATADSSWT